MALTFFLLLLFEVVHDDEDTAEGGLEKRDPGRAPCPMLSLLVSLRTWVSWDRSRSRTLKLEMESIPCTAGVEVEVGEEVLLDCVDCGEFEEDTHPRHRRLRYRSSASRACFAAVLHRLRPIQ